MSSFKIIIVVIIIHFQFFILINILNVFHTTMCLQYNLNNFTSLTNKKH